MKRIFPVFLLLLMLCLTGCCESRGYTYTRIDQDTAKEMMADDGHVVVDVRRQDEYDAGHIPGAVLIPNESIGRDAPEALPDYDQIILIYCRSGNRSKQAAEKLAGMGYTHVYEFGGIMDWTGDTVTTEEERADAALDSLTNFYYTYDASTSPPYYQRYRFYTEDGEYFFFHETREGGGWPQREEDITKTGTVKLSEEEWNRFINGLKGGSIRQPEDDVTDGDAGPWIYIWHGSVQEEYEFPSYGDRLAFEAYCERLSSMRIRVTDGTHTVIYQLNNSPSAKSLYAMLPMDAEVENYGSNEKIFYPEAAVDTADGIEGGGKAGGLALFSPWGNVVMYYDSFGSYPGLYILGEAVEGTDQIKDLAGSIHVEAAE